MFTLYPDKNHKKGAYAEKAWYNSRPCLYLYIIIFARGYGCAVFAAAFVYLREALLRNKTNKIFCIRCKSSCTHDIYILQKVFYLAEIWLKICLFNTLIHLIFVSLTIPFLVFVCMTLFLINWKLTCTVKKVSIYNWSTGCFTETNSLFELKGGGLFTYLRIDKNK